jgi:hypothetical protein
MSSHEQDLFNRILRLELWVTADADACPSSEIRKEIKKELAELRLDHIGKSLHREPTILTEEAKKNDVMQSEPQPTDKNGKPLVDRKVTHDASKPGTILDQGSLYGSTIVFVRWDDGSEGWNRLSQLELLPEPEPNASRKHCPICGNVCKRQDSDDGKSPIDLKCDRCEVYHSVTTQSIFPQPEPGPAPVGKDEFEAELVDDCGHVLCLISSYELADDLAALWNQDNPNTVRLKSRRRKDGRK